jgi:hypothetical protein
MSIVERAAELLGTVENGSAEHGQTNRPSPQHPLSDKLSPIERAVSGTPEPSDFLEEPRLVPQPEDHDRNTEPAHTSGRRTGSLPAAFRSRRAAADVNASRTSETLRVDRGHLPSNRRF